MLLAGDSMEAMPWHEQIAHYRAGPPS